MSRSWRTAGWLAASAVLWAGVGVAGTLLVLREASAPGPQGNLEQLTQALQVLDLTDDQRRSIQDIVAAYGDSVLALHVPVEQAEAEFWNQVLLAEQRADQAILAVLDQDQRRRYEDLTLGRLDQSGPPGADTHR